MISEYIHINSQENQLIVGHISGSRTELGIGLDHFIYGINKVLFRGNLEEKRNKKTVIRWKYVHL